VAGYRSACGDDGLLSPAANLIRARVRDLAGLPVLVARRHRLDASDQVIERRYEYLTLSS
jgi:hypothetical protein